MSLDFVMDVPATCARIRMACEDEITGQVKTIPIITYFYFFYLSIFCNNVYYDLVCISLCIYTY